MSGVLIDTVGYRATYGVLLGIAAAQAVVLWHHRALLPNRHDAAPAAEATPMFDLFRHRAVRDVLVATALITMAWELQTFLVPIHGSQAGLSASEIGLALGAFSAATFVVRLALAWLSRSFREWQVLTFTLFTATIAYALMPLSTSLAPLLGVMFLLGLGLGAAQPNVMALLHERSPPGRVGEALGLRVAIINSSSVVLPLVYGAAGAVLGAAAAFWAMAAVLGVGGFAAHKRARDSRPTGDAVTDRSQP